MIGRKIEDFKTSERDLQQFSIDLYRATEEHRQAERQGFNTAIVEFESVYTFDRTITCDDPSDAFQILL